MYSTSTVFPTGVPATINTVDHNTYQENFNTYVQQPDDVMCWFAGYRMRAFASRGVVGDVSDVWESIGAGCCRSPVRRQTRHIRHAGARSLPAAPTRSIVAAPTCRR